MLHSAAVFIENICKHGDPSVSVVLVIADILTDNNWRKKKRVT